MATLVAARVLQAAGAAGEAYPQGVWWVPLAPVSTAGEVASVAARVLGGGGSLPEVVAERRLLLVLDNFEHVIGAAAEVADLLLACRHVDVIVTSRERLRVQAEQVYPVPVLARTEARTLFVARARSAQPEFEPDLLVDELCERLDAAPVVAPDRDLVFPVGVVLEGLEEREPVGIRLVERVEDVVCDAGSDHLEEHGRGHGHPEPQNRLVRLLDRVALLERVHQHGRHAGQDTIDDEGGRVTVGQDVGDLVADLAYIDLGDDPALVPTLTFAEASQRIDRLRGGRS